MRGTLKKIDPVARHLHIRKRAEDAPEGYVTRRGLREQVGITDAQIRMLLARDIVSADSTNSHGYAVYSMKTVERLRNMKADGSLFRSLAAEPNPSDPRSVTSRYSAEEGVRVFELLHEGRSLEDIILTTKIHPLVVKFIRGDYDDITGSIHLPKRVVDKINGIKNLPGSFPLRDANGVLESFELYAENRTCNECKTQQALDRCQDCHMHAHRLARQREREALAEVVDIASASPPRPVAAVPRSAPAATRSAPAPTTGVDGEPLRR